MRIAALASVALAIGSLWPVGPARAQDEQGVSGESAEGPPASAAAPETLDPARAEAQAQFQRGVELGQQERWAEALEHFRRSLAVLERPNTVFNIGFANHRLGRFREAIAAFDQYLAMTEGEASERRDEAARLRGEAVASLAEIRLTIDPADARLLVDGEADEGTGAERVLVLDPGRHTLRATAEGRDEATLSVAVLAGERGERRMTLEATASEEAPPEPPAGGTSVFEDPVFWIVAGAIVLAGGVAIGTGLGVAADSRPDYRGSTGVVLEALRF